MTASARHGLSHDERLRDRDDYRRCIKQGVRVRGRAIVVCAIRNGRDVTRLGAGSTKRLGGAVARNRQKRLVREAFRLVKHRLPTGIDVVVLPLVPWPEPTLEDLKADLLGAMERAEAKLVERTSRCSPTEQKTNNSPPAAR